MKTILGAPAVVACVAFSAGFSKGAAGAAIEVSAQGKVESVALYRGQALVFLDKSVGEPYNKP
jgi:hypothetical protein